MRELVEQVIDASGRRGAVPPGARPRGRSVTVNVAESPLGWLAARGLVSARQNEAGERLRADYETAAIAPAVTMRWEARVDGGAPDGLSPASGRSRPSAASTPRWRASAAGCPTCCGA